MENEKFENGFTTDPAKNIQPDTSVPEGSDGIKTPEEPVAPAYVPLHLLLLLLRVMFLPQQVMYLPLRVMFLP